MSVLSSLKNFNRYKINIFMKFSHKLFCELNNSNNKQIASKKEKFILELGPLLQNFLSVHNVEIKKILAGYLYLCCYYRMLL